MVPIGLQIFEAAVFGLLIGAGGIVGGAALTLFIKVKGKKLPAALMGLAAGIMLITVFLDMFPHSLEYGAWQSVLFFGVTGAFATLLAARFVPHIDALEYDEDDEHIKRLKHSGLLLAAGIAIHNLPQGIALGSGIAAGFAFLLGILLFLHNLPEGMAMGMPLKIGGVPGKKILKIATLAALPTCIGAVIGVLVSSVSPVFICGATSFAAGSMLFLTLTELIPQAIHFKKGFFPIAFLIVGAALGAIIIFLTHGE